MKKKLFFLFVAAVLFSYEGKAQGSPVIRLTDQTLMHEMRLTPFPLDKEVVDDRSVSFQWPLPPEARSEGTPMDGFEHLAKKIDKSKLAYKIRYAQDASFKKGVVEADTRWPFYNSVW